MVVNLDPRRKVDLPNFAVGEGDCSCGCGLKLTDETVLTLQGFLLFLARKYGKKFNIKINSGARCPTRNKEAGGEPNSQHLYGLAADCTFWYRNKEGVSVQLPNDTVAREAQDSHLFGGVGVKQYQNQNKNLVHIDIRPGYVAVLW